MKVLVVDDDPISGAIVSAVLEEAGHDVVAVENGMEAVEALNEDETFSLIVSDMHMPLINGIELFQTVRENDIAIPFVLLTGDDPAPLLGEEPALNGCLIKDDSLEESLPAMIAAITGS